MLSTVALTRAHNFKGTTCKTAETLLYSFSGSGHGAALADAWEVGFEQVLLPVDQMQREGVALPLSRLALAPTAPSGCWHGRPLYSWCRGDRFLPNTA